MCLMQTGLVGRWYLIDTTRASDELSSYTTLVPALYYQCYAGEMVRFALCIQF